MSLRVWLPLTKDLRNQGLDDVTVTNNGATFNSAGKLGGSYTGRIDVSSSIIPTILNGSEFTVAFWIYINEVPTGSGVTDTYVMACGTGGTRTQFHIAIRQNGAGFAFCFYSDDYTFYNTVTDKVGKWMHVVCAFKNNTQIVYVDGIKVGERATTGGLNIVANSVLNIYATHERLNDVRIYDHCLSPLEVKELSKGLVLHYPLNRQGWGQENLLKNSQGIIVDKTGNTSGSRTEYYAWDVGDSYTNITTNTVVTISFDLEMYVNDLTTYGGQLQVYNTNNKGPVQISGKYYTFKNKYAIGETINERVSLITTLIPRSDANRTNNYIEFYTGYGSDNFYKISNVKLELGSVATPWCPNSSDALATSMGLNDNVEYDTSGYGNNSTYNLKPTISSDTPKYNVSTFFGVFDTPKTVLNDSTVLGGLTNCTVAWWEKCTTTGSTLIFSGQDQFYYIGAGNSSNPLYDFNIGTSGITLYKDGEAVNTSYNGSRVNHSGTYHIKNEWHHYVLTGADLSNWTTFKINDYHPSWPTNAYLSDVRIYATALSANDVKSLYNNSAYIDNQGNIYGAVYEEV